MEGRGWAGAQRALPQPPGAGRQLGPFLLACSVYFLWAPKCLPSWPSAALKCLPVLCLVLFLQASPTARGRIWLLRGALLCSAVGDACLVWPETLLPGMAAFAATHLLYLRAFGPSPLRPSLLLLTLLASATYLSLLLPHLPGALAGPVVAYALLLATVLWRGLARGGSAGLGMLLFAVSDVVLAWHNFVRPLCHGHLVTMTTYYTAQVLITLSLLRSPGG